MQPSCPTEPVPARRAAARPAPSCPAVDRNVPEAVGAVLGELLDERTAEAAALDATFARDIAGSTARFTLDGGRRTRSQLLWWALRACGGGEEERHAGLRVAAALELIQTCALVQDDVMDGSPRRRGRPAFHVRLDQRYGDPPAPWPGAPGGAPSFGACGAVLAGDLALAWADDIVADTAFGPDVRPRVLADWRAMRTEMVAGQYLDLHSQVSHSRSPGRALRTACLKSALYTVGRPLALGAAVAGADARTADALRSAGRSAGIAFQLRDDLDGLFGDPADTGKPAGEDVRAGKHTYLAALARSAAAARGDTRALAVLDRPPAGAPHPAHAPRGPHRGHPAHGPDPVYGGGEAHGPDTPYDPGRAEEELAEVRRALVRTGARDLVEARIARLLGVAERRLATAGLDPDAADRLAALLHAASAPRAAGAPAALLRPEGPPALVAAGDGAVR
ncbi:polyprenyl synthetase family protein [Streptomyces sp. NPDC005805]|uniref:polyprenyl synthetase family protein n=1 Tax=Streptomyces sp. NPDC005805 TaxID=3157068 RepID=UPI0034019313